MANVTRQTEREMERILFGEIAGVADSMNRYAMNMDLDSIKKHLYYLFKLSRRIDAIRKQSPQERGHGPKA